jgi:probable H4MPT-linked C1 transfer pathway protein
LGLDIGGANTKAAFIRTCDGRVAKLEMVLEYFPFWKRDMRQLCSMLSALKFKAAGSAVLDSVVVTLTAELSDAYSTKREGVNCILDCVCQAFKETPVLVLTVDSVLVSVEAAKAEPLNVAAANWAATGWMVSQQIRNCVIIDVGSTSTSIIPITEGEVAAVGKTDLEKLANGELVYTGSLRTNVVATAQLVPLRGVDVRVSSEFFAQSGDVHLVLGNIEESEYTVDTPDGRGKTHSQALGRLARVLCADSGMLTEQETLGIAKHVHAKQVAQIAEGLTQVYSRLAANAKGTVPAVVTGMGRDFLARKAAEKVGITKILSLDELTPKEVMLASPAAGVALMAATKFEGRCVTWKQ